jgi:uncharacterized protein (DUF2236 family)
MAMVDSFLDTAVRSGVALDEREQDDYVLQMVEFADLVGVPRSDVPSSRAELVQYFNQISPELEASEDAKRAAIFLALPPLPTIVRFAIFADVIELSGTVNCEESTHVAPL